MLANRILVADDQADVLESLRLLLKNEGFVIDAVSSPPDVVEAVKRGNYDVLLLDMNYARDTTSGGEGLQLLARIQQLEELPPVILMTAWSNVELAVEAMRIGGCDFIQKPWDNRKLIAILQRSIAEGRLKRWKRKQEKDSEEVIRDLEEARETQRRLLPSEMPQVAGVEIHTSWRPAGSVGGDYFDAIRLTGNLLAFCIADVAGKGLPAALLMSHIQATVRAYASVNMPPAEMCRQLNQTVYENTQARRFITLFYGLLDTDSRSLLFTNAGHVPPVLVRQDGRWETLTAGGTVLGSFPDCGYEQAAVSLHPGDRVILMTDGITEAENDAGEQFGENDRIAEFLCRNRGLTAEELKDGLLDAVASFSAQKLQDDATLMVLSML